VLALSAISHWSCSVKSNQRL